MLIMLGVGLGIGAVIAEYVVDEVEYWFSS